MKTFDEYARDLYADYLKQAGVEALYPVLVTCEGLDLKSRQWFDAAIKSFPVAAFMYEAYYLGVCGQDRNGNPLPTYEQMSDDLRECWVSGVLEGVKCAANIANTAIEKQKEIA